MPDSDPGTGSDIGTLLAELNQRLAHSQDVFQRESGGLSQCEVGRCRVPSLTVKRAEGSMHALIDLIRLVQSVQKEQGTELAEGLAQLQEKWLAVSQLSEQWQVYRQAGLDEVQSVIDRLV